MSEAVAGARETTEARPAARLGAELRAARQKLGWELPMLAGSLRIRLTYLEAIEAGRMGDLPGNTYALGFVRTYASALGLSGEEVAGRFRSEAAEVQQKPTLSFPAPVPQRGVPAGALMLLGVVLMAGAYAGWYYVTEHQHTPVETVPPIPDRLLPPSQATQQAAPPKPSPSPQIASILPSASPPSPAPAAAPSATPAPQSAGQAPLAAVNGVPPAVPAPAPTAAAPGGAVATLPAPSAAQPVPGPAPAAPSVEATAVPPGTRLVIRTSADAWVTIKQKGGPALLNKLMHAGDVFPVPADKPGLTLTTGNAGGTALLVDGTAIDGLGGSGMVRRDLPLDADALKTGKLPPIVHGKPKPAAPPAGDAQGEPER